MDLVVEPGTSAVIRQSRRYGEFRDFYQAEADGIYRGLALALGDVDLAQEATHEGMVRAFQRWRRIKHYDSAAGWVYRVGLNWARSRIRKTRKEVLAGVSQEFEPMAPVDSRSLFAADSALGVAVAALSVEARSVVVLRYVLGWSTADTAAALGVAEGTVKSRLSRALRQLETQLEEQ